MDAPLPAPATKHVAALQHALPRSELVLTLRQRTATADGRDTGTTGTTLWLGGQVLAAYLASLPPSPGAAVELGAGVGFLALSLAAAGHDVLATDVEPVLSAVLAPNLDAGVRVLGGAGVPARATPALLDWVEVADALAAGRAPFANLDPGAAAHIARADTLVTTDTLYAPHLIQPLWATLAAMCAGRDRPPAVYLALERRDPRLVDAGLDGGREAGFELRRIAHGRVVKALDRAGWRWAPEDWAGVEVWRAKWRGEAREAAGPGGA
ncbi:hypothetical protein VHUM_02200 [Vanrija humicola]|uniref:Uncharacterized protein n=1 Tax=Vanrija humicola TaxID=5417 RepID=A0A7D8YZ51_VANHU|nr:hypothetical protein VHUM_02200 [Vanrija humicola]